eukprot:2637605-Ditylum_brightwellii.AAC.1
MSFPQNLEVWHEGIDECSFNPRDINWAKMLDEDDKDVDLTSNVEMHSSLVDVLCNPWESSEYETLMSGNFVGVVLKFENESDIEYMTAYAQSRVQMKSTYLTIA